MRLVVRQMSEGTFFRSPDLWVKLAEEATEVDSLDSALKCLNGRDLSGLELVVISDKGHPAMGFSLSDLVTKPQR